MQLSANDIIGKSLVKARVLFPGEAVKNYMQTQVYDTLVGLLESWSLEGLMILSTVIESFTLSSGTANYTYGTGGNFDSARPVFIKDQVFIRDGSEDYPCKVVGMEDYRRYTTKSISSRPYRMAYNPSHPLMSLYFFPTPDSNYPIHFNVEKELTSFADKTTKVNLANGVARMIIANLAVEISPDFGKKPLLELVAQANESMSTFKTYNSKLKKKIMRNPHLSAMAGGRRGTFNVISGPFD